MRSAAKVRVPHSDDWMAGQANRACGSLPRSVDARAPFCSAAASRRVLDRGVCSHLASGTRTFSQPVGRLTPYQDTKDRDEEADRPVSATIDR